MIKNESLKIFIDKINIIDVIKSYIKLEKKGQNYWALCPFHEDTNPSLSVSPNKKIFKCFVCNEKGGPIQFVEKIKKISFKEAIKEISNICNINIDHLSFLFYKNEKDEYLEKIYEINNQASYIYNRTLFNKENLDVLNYLTKERNISLDLIKEYNIGFAPKNNYKYLYSIMTNENNLLGEKRDNKLIWSPAQLVNSNLVIINSKNEYNDFFKNRIIFPIRNEGKNVIGFSGRSLEKEDKIKYLNSKSSLFFKKDEVLFNFENFEKNKYDEIYLVEGYFDVLSFKSVGIHNVIASMGTNFSNNHINKLSKYENIKTVILCFDNDDAGYNATKESALKLLKNGFNIFVLKPFNKKYKDFNDLLCKTSKEDFLKIINDQTDYVDYEIIKEFYKIDNFDEKETFKKVNKIINILKEIPNNIFFTKNLENLSKFSKLNIEDIRSYFNKKSFFNFSDTNDYFEEEKNIKYKIIEDKFKKNSNRKYTFEKNYSNFEKTLLEILPNNIKLIKIFFENYIGKIIFIKDEKELFLYKNILLNLKKFYKKNDSFINYDNFIKYIFDNEIDKSLKEQMIYFITKSKKNMLRDGLSEDNQFIQGFNIICDLLDKVYNMKKNYINKNYSNKNTELEKTKLYYEKNKKIIDSFKVLNDKNILKK